MQGSTRLGMIAVALAGSGLMRGTASAQGFEGAMRYSIQDESGKTSQIVQLTKHGKVSTQFTQNGKTSAMIVDSAARTMTFVNGEDKSYIVINMALMQGMMSGLTGMAQSMRGRHGPDSTHRPAGPPPTITRTDRTEVVAGVRCAVYTYDGMVDGKHEAGEACLAKGVGGLFSGGGMGMMGMGMQRRPGLEERMHEWGPIGDLLAQGYGILKATFSEDGKPKGSMEVTGIQRGAPPDAAFLPPADYKAKSMANMMGGPH